MVVDVTYQVSLYWVAVTPRRAKTSCAFIYMSFLDEKMAPLVITRSLTMFGSEIATKSWFPMVNENRLPYCFAHLSRVSSGYFARCVKQPE